MPKGKLIAIGGNVDKGTRLRPTSKGPKYINFFELGILKRIIHETRGDDPYIEVITTASMIPEEIGQNYLIAFAKLGGTKARVMHIKNREDAANPEYLERIKQADGVMFTGGDQ